MNTIKCIVDETSVYIECPECQSCEQLGINESRKNFGTMPIFEWMPDIEDRNELSKHECLNCRTKFIVEWDYSNIDIEE